MQRRWARWIVECSGRRWLWIERVWVGRDGGASIWGEGKVGWSEWREHSGAKTTEPEHVECIVDLCRRVQTRGLWGIIHSPLCLTTLSDIWWTFNIPGGREGGWDRRKEREREEANGKNNEDKGSWNHIVEILHCQFLEFGLNLLNYMKSLKAFDRSNIGHFIWNLVETLDDFIFLQK